MATAVATPYDECVFINCPFDDEYQPMLHALLFTVVQCGFRPRIATERSDSGEVRIKKITDLIRECRYSIHDISRIEPQKAGDLPRFNMPFELGIDIGCRELGEELFRTKRCLVLESEKFRYQRVLSDISGNDIKAHHSDPILLIKALRSWFAENGVFGLASPSRLWDAYNEFLSRLTDEARLMGYADGRFDEIPIPEYIYLVTRLAPPTKA